ncbi:choice-of-anchor G family protein [Leucobacter sp. HY1910]
MLGAGAVAASVAMVATALIAPAASADSKTTSSVSAAHGHALNVGLSTNSAVGAASAFTEWKASGQTGTPSATVDVSLLENEILNLGGVSIPLIAKPGTPGLLDLGDLGAMKAYADSPYQSVSTSSAGVVGDDGSVLLSPAAVPSTFEPASLDVSALIEQALGAQVRQAVLDQASLEIGALGSTASGTAASATPATQYMVAGADLNLHSPAVGTVATTLDTALDGVGTTLNTAVGTGGALGSVVAGLPDIDIGVLSLDLSGGTIALDGLDQAIEDVTDTLIATPLVDSNGIVSISLETGMISVNLAKVVAGGDLNGLPANTEVLDSVTLGKITAAVTDALGTLTGKVSTAVTDLVNNLSVTIKLNVKLSAVGVIGVANEVITVQAKLGQLTGDIPGNPTVAITSNNQTVLGLILTLLGVNDLLGTITGPVLGLLTNNLTTPIGTLLTTVTGNVTGALNPVIASTVADLGPVLNTLNKLLTIKVNEQQSGDLGTSSKTVRALAITLLPVGSTGAAKVELASSTVKHKFDATPPGSANTNASASAAASASANTSGTTNAAATAAAQAAAMADNSTSAQAQATTNANAAAKSAALTNASTNASNNATSSANSSAQAAATASQNSQANSASNAKGTAQADANASASSKAAAQATASTNASSDAAASGTTSGTSTANPAAQADANVNASASASADSKANAAAQAAATADAQTTASAKATANAQSAAKAAATQNASTNASTSSSGSSKAAAQAAAHSKADSDSNASGTASQSATANAAAAVAANASASSNASGTPTPPNPGKCDVKKPRANSPFLDVATSHKFYPEIDWMHCTKLSTGWKVTGGHEYRPSADMTREAMAAFIFRMQAPKNYKAPEKSLFKDVKTNHKFYREIMWMKESGTSTGYADGTYRPGTKLDRDAMAAFIFRMNAPTNYTPGTSKFIDVTPSTKFYREITWMGEEKLSGGYRVDAGYEYRPKNTLSREAMAAFIERLVDDYWNKVIPKK